MERDNLGKLIPLNYNNTNIEGSNELALTLKKLLDQNQKKEELPFKYLGGETKTLKDGGDLINFQGKDPGSKIDYGIKGIDFSDLGVKNNDNGLFDLGGAIEPVTAPTGGFDLEAIKQEYMNPPKVDRIKPSILTNSVKLTENAIKGDRFGLDEVSPGSDTPKDDFQPKLPITLPDSPPNKVAPGVTPSAKKIEDVVSGKPVEMDRKPVGGKSELAAKILSLLGQGMSGLGAASRAYVGDQGGTAQHLDYWGKLRAGEQKQAQAEKDNAWKTDPNSDSSKLTRDLVKKYLGVNVPDNATYKSLMAIPGAKQIGSMVMQQRAAAQRDSGDGLSAYQREQLARQDERDRTSKERGQGLRTKELASNLAPYNQADQAFNEIAKKVGFSIDDITSGKIDPEKVDIPGFNIPGTGRWNLTDKARELDGNIQKLFNVVLKDRSGAAVTTPEMNRLKSEFNSGLFDSESSKLKALALYKREIDRMKKELRSGYSDDVIASYESGQKREGLEEKKERNIITRKAKNGKVYKFDAETKENLGEA